jgi:sugar O-acyltransferase (sialic acid O-acetyltransferase NeuD family)
MIQVMGREGTVHVAGTGSFAAEVVDYATLAGLTVAGLLELYDSKRIGTTVHGLCVVALEAPPAEQPHAVLGAGGDRSELWALLATHGWIPTTVLHPRAVLSATTEVGAGVVVGPLAVLGAHATVADLTLVGRGALIGHHASIGEGVVVNPGANIGGNTSIGAGSRIGMGATILNGLTIGAGAVIAAGAVVVRDVPAGVRVQGVPARAYDAGDEEHEES